MSPLAAKYCRIASTRALYSAPPQSIYLRGADISSLTGELIALSTLLIVTLSLAIRRFRKRLD